MEANRWDGSAVALARDLARQVRGEVRFDAGARALYATDSSNYRQVPIGVVLPADVDDAVAALEVCRRHRAPVLGRGGGTSLAGQCCNVAVVLDFSRHVTGVLEVDPARRLARVEPGAVLDRVREAAEVHGLTFGPDPATHRHCTIGGMIGNNSCGVHSVMAGRTADNVEALDVLTGDGVRLSVGATSDEELRPIVAAGGRRGEIYAALRELRDRHADEIRRRFPRIPRRVSGFNLDELLPERGFHVARALVGTEGTCVTVLGATLRLVRSPQHRVLVLLGFEDIAAAADHVLEVLAAKPIGLEGIDHRLIESQARRGMPTEALALFSGAGGWLVVEIGDDTAAAAAASARTLAARFPLARVVEDAAARARVWEVRETALGATAVTPGQKHAWEGWEDSAVPPERLGAYVRRLRALLDAYGYTAAFYGHFGDGCLHTRITFDLESRPGIDRFRRFMHEAADLVLAHGGSLSGEHGDGQARGELLPRMFGAELVDAFRAFKRIWDPEGRMNPGKVVDAAPMDADLRYGETYRPARPATHFAFPEDGGIQEAVGRCVGVGRCRREGGGVMCPSYMATREERHSTRGRARLLFEMLRGEVLAGGWRDPNVREALDLCLACKGCRSDCPTGVDMATLKAEFLAHHYEGRVRPRAAYALGLVSWWARIGSRAPGLVNAVVQSRIGGALARAAAGVAPSRSLPPFAPRTARDLLAGRRSTGARPVVLWLDTFTNHFEPGVAEAAREVLESAGLRVAVQPEGLCCGRPLYDFGMLRLARRFLEEVLDAMEPAIAAGTPIVVLEPSCASVFRDELGNLFPRDPRARALASRVTTLGGALAMLAPEAGATTDGARALLHLHCHQRAVLGTSDERKVLARAGFEIDIPDPGCCGMAGAFGFEREHRDVSVAIGERVLLPAVRVAGPGTVVVADGFSCRQQILQGTGRRALHTAEALRLRLGRSAPRTPASS